MQIAPTLPTTLDAADGPAVTLDTLRRFDVPGPRYTSYPTADRFVTTFDAAAYEQALKQFMAADKAQPLSIYVHIPFCESLCFYCACNKIITKNHERAAEYLRYLRREIELHVDRLGVGQTVTQLHLGGGSPTFLSDDELTGLMDLFRRSFNLVPDGEYSVEIDPRTVDEKRLEHIASLGFNRLSFGVQDFDPEVQKSVHRIQPAEQVFGLVDVVRRIGFDSVNVDLIYGLPKQTPQSFARTLQQVTELRPDRIALYAYAHLPQRFKPQRYIKAAELPAAPDKVGMLSAAISAFLDAGYVYVGMDHFALPEDALAVAKREGRLHRNFQGYSTQPDCDLIGLGVSAIGRVGATYSQNAKTLKEYYAVIDQGHFAVNRGLEVSAEDELRRDVIMSVMCQGALQYDAIGRSYGIDFKNHFASELEELKNLAAPGLLELHEDGLRVTDTGWYFVRAIAMVFDQYLQRHQNFGNFSKII